MIRGGRAQIKNLLSPGKYFMSGNEACALGAISCGCSFYAGYPITPSTEIAETMARELPKIGGKFIQMEDELASIMALAGASWAGMKSMTATSGPGFSLMQEGISYLLMTETPAVIVNVQRAGPSTGQPTKPATGDIREARWGAHGGTQLIAVCPSSVQECYELTIKAFNLSEQFRVPVIVLMDGYLGHLYESLNVTEEVLEVFERIYKPKEPPFGPTKDFSIPSMPNFDDGERLVITGSTHNQWGIRNTDGPEIQEAMMDYLQNKIIQKKLFDAEELFLDDAKTIIVAYGSAARSAKWAVTEARAMGLKIGLFRPRILWPFASDRIRELSRQRGRKFVVPEMNQGQLNYVVREKISNEVISLPQPNGEIIDPRRIIKFLTEGEW
ncbi:MAG: 2-oxoacid:acceptor oxidoreductase subunit alpha [Candidatus Nealsonbacteria bacterium]|nr:2-oxoacid:acceptor oxidoreductase subunit alpha [Candidatus Nealsonbacteria bacterium]